MIPVFLSVRMGSARLPAKCFLPLSTGDSVLQHTIKRAQWYGFDPVVCSPTCDKELINDHLRLMTVKTYFGPLENKLKRWYLAAKHFNFSTFHAVDVDDPYYCHLQIRKNYSRIHEENDKTVFPSEYSDMGGATDGYSFNVKNLQKYSEMDDSSDTSYVPKWIAPEDRLYNQDPEYETPPTRLTLDYYEDYIYLYNLSKTFGFSSNRSEVQSYLNHKNLFDNLHLNERWKLRQLKE